jgi:hypothetical protein
MISPVSQPSQVSPQEAASTAPKRAASTPAPQQPQQDQVKFSATALAAAHDVDHDGDSH